MITYMIRYRPCHTVLINNVLINKHTTPLGQLACEDYLYLYIYVQRYVQIYPLYQPTFPSGINKDLSYFIISSCSITWQEKISYHSTYVRLYLQLVYFSHSVGIILLVVVVFVLYHNKPELEQKRSS